MNTIKTTKYLIFNEEEQIGRKTKIIHVINRTSEEEIATIEWYKSWRQYCFFPESWTLWNNSCLTDIIEVLNQFNIKQKFNQSKKGE